MAGKFWDRIVPTGAHGQGATMLRLLLSLLLPALLAIPALAQESQEVTRAADMPATLGSANFFTGTVRQQRLFDPTDDAFYNATVVTFAPGARTLWHTHPAGQRLIVLEGEGLTGTADGMVRVIRKGDAVWCPPGVRHWHGASPASAMTHLALTGSAGGRTVQWLAPVSDEEYSKQPVE